jgi:uncharacterized protein (TIGR03545 family)
MTRPGFKLFRWRAIGPLLLFLLLLVVLWVVFADAVARRQAEINLSEILGTQVDIGRLTIRETEAAVEVAGLAIADPRDPRRNLLEAGAVVIDLDPVPLTEKKLVIDRLSLNGLQFLTARQTPARPADPNSPAGRLLRQTESWAREKFQIPSLVMGRVDSVRSLALDPGQLGTVKAAEALAGRVDSTRRAFEEDLGRLQVQALVDSSAALATELAALDPKKLGVAGVQRTVSAVQQAMDRLRRAETRLKDLEQSARASLGTLQQGLGEVEAARQRDYAFARSLLQLPGLDAPDISAALFGAPSTGYFEAALGYARLIERYVPPGLQPWKRPGPKRTRLDGTTVEFPKAAEYPRFLLKQGDVDLTVGGPVPGALKASAGGISSQPALVGVPATLAVEGALGRERQVEVHVAAMARHFGAEPRDSLAARLTGVSLPTIRFPDLPFGVHPGASTLNATFSLAGDRLQGSWEVLSSRVTWLADSTRLRHASLIEGTIWRVITGVTTLRVRADLGGTIERPTLAIRSNLDEALAGQLRALVGEEVAKAERKAREAVDRLVEQQVGALQGKVNGLTSQVAGRLPVERQQLDAVHQRLEAELRRLTRGAAGGISLPRL